MFVPAAHHLDEKVGVAVVGGEVADLVAHEERWAAVVAEAAVESAGRVLGGEIEEEPGGGDEEDRVSGQNGIVGDVLGDHRLAEPWGATRTSLRACWMKSRARVDSTVVRSMRFGQTQSKALHAGASTHRMSRGSGTDGDIDRSGGGVRYENRRGLAPGEDREWWGPAAPWRFRLRTRGAREPRRPGQHGS
jgi:hypothetical protein